VVDLVESKAFIYVDRLGKEYEETEIPADLKNEIHHWNEVLMEAVAENSDELMHKYMEGHSFTIEEKKKALRALTIKGEIVPVVCGTALKNKGVQMLLDAVVDYLPSPADIPPVKGLNPKTGEMVERIASEKEPFSALAFKLVSDPFVGKLTYFRVYSGKLAAGSYIYNSSKEKQERIGRILRMHANEREEIKEISAGDIGAAVGLKFTTTGDTLCDQAKAILLEAIQFPEPVISVAIEPRSKIDQEKLSVALNKLAEEDPTFKVKNNEETGQTIISGMGELHLEIIVDRMLREFSVSANVGRPQVAYKETITTTTEVEGRFIRQTGGRGQYGHVWLKLEPLASGSGLEFKNEITGGVIPREYIPAVEKGIREAALGGGTTGYPVTDLRVSLFDGSFHEVDSSEIAFKIAGSLAFKNGVEKARPLLLEPFMKIEVVIPENYLGDVVGDLNSRRGRIEGMEFYKGIQTIKSRVPLAQMFGYATTLRSITQGRGTYTMEFSDYEPVPADIAETILASMKGSKEK
jgi:elongation factor G